MRIVERGMLGINPAMECCGIICTDLVVVCGGQRRRINDGYIVVLAKLDECLLVYYPLLQYKIKYGIIIKRRMIEMKRIKIELSPEEDAIVYYEKTMGRN
ncbi:MAG: hypothetical protein IJJ69_10255, partial [Oscillospiraceae bacterium]|nr:hypothetical protein [Oscillospiraceae bacterium]